MAKAAHKQARGREARRGATGATSLAARRPPSDGRFLSAAEVVQWHRSAEQALREADREIVRRAPAVYLNGDELDRGALCLSHQALRFDGWQGSIVIPISDILDVRLGTSVLPRHAGIPLLGRIWPGRPRYAESLLLTVGAGSASEPRVATVADLRDGIQWRDEIMRCRDDYEAWLAERAQRVAEIRAAEENLERARQAGRPAAGNHQARDNT